MTDNCRCNTCGKYFHHCYNCGNDEWWDEYMFCSEKCAKQNPGYIEDEKLIRNFVESLNEQQKAQFADIICSMERDILDPITCDMGGFSGICAWGLW